MTGRARLNAITRWVLALNAVSCLGSGLTVPFLIVYMHQVRGLSLSAAGLLLSATGLATLVTMPFAGSLIDRIGPFRAFGIGQLVGAAGRSPTSRRTPRACCWWPGCCSGSPAGSRGTG